MARQNFANVAGTADFKTVAPENLTPPAPQEPVVVTPTPVPEDPAHVITPTTPAWEETNVEIAKTMSDDDLPESGERRVVGWLVCTKGSSAGKDFRLHSEFNYIGRGAKHDVNLPDEKVSSDAMAWICYDRIEREFTVAKGDHPTNLTRLNGKPVYSPMPLKGYDRIQLGDTELMFIPLCSSEFSWETEDETKEEK